MSMRTLKWLTIILPPLLIGGFEYVRHEFLLGALSMEAGNWYITLLTLLVSFFFSTWVFHHIRRANERLAGEKAARAVYEERERLAQELHDNIAQALFFLNVQLKKGQLEEAGAGVSEIDHHLRQAIFNLRTAPEEGASFEARLNAWLDEWSSISGIPVERRMDPGMDKIEADSEVKLFSVIREAFTNIRKHSEAGQAFIELGQLDGGRTWRLRIWDDGIGFGDRAASVSPTHWGLTFLRKRAEELHAEIIVQTGAQGGAEIILTGGMR